MTSEMRPHGQDPSWAEAFWSRAAESSDELSIDSSHSLNERGSTASDLAAEASDHLDPVSSLSCEQFELLSAYLDDEVTEPERALVEGWLATDPMIRQAFQNLGGLSRSMSQVPVPQSASVEQTVRAVMARIDRRHRRVHWLGGSAIAAAITAAIASVGTGNHDMGWQLASNRPAPESSAALSSESPEAASPSGVKATKTAAIERSVGSVVERALIVE